MKKFSPAVPWKAVFKTIFSLIFFTGYYFYLKIGINPVLSYQWQEPTFFFGARFLHNFLSFPGGPAQYAANFIAQFYIIPWAGAAIMTITTWMICRVTYLVVKKIDPETRFFFLYYIPAVLLIPLHSLYKHPFEITLGILVALYAFLLYIRYSPRNTVVKIILPLITSSILYYLLGGTFFLYAILCILYELFVNRNFILSPVQAILAVLLPFIAMQVFIVNKSDAFLLLLPFTTSYQPAFAPYLLYGYLVLLIPALVYAVKLNTNPATGLWKRITDLGKLVQNKRGWVIKGAALIILTVIFALLSFNKQNKVLLLADNYAQNKEWVKVLDLARERVSHHRLVAFQSYRALYFTGHLANNMFSLSQERGTESLVMSREFSNTAPLQSSQLFLELGMVNEAQHWAHEAIALKKETPWILQQLVIVSLVKEDYAFAQICLNKLKQTILFKDWANNWQHYVDNPQSIASNTMIKNFRAGQVTCDHFIRGNEIREILEFVSGCSNNRMAFEYLMACYLLTGRLDEIAKNIPRLKDFNYQYIPRHYEEALLLYTMRNKTDIDLGGYKISTGTRERFKDFNNIIMKYSDGKISARRELAQKHGNTYWYFALYN